MQPDGGFVQHVQHAREAAADLARQPYPLGLASRERGRRSVQCEVVQADVHQEAQPPLDLLEQLAGYQGVGSSEFELLEEIPHALDRHRVQLVYAPPRDENRPRLRTQPRTAAGGARGLPEEPLVVDPRPLARCRDVEPLEPGYHPLPGALHASTAVPALPLELEDPSLAGAVEDGVPLLLVQADPGGPEGESVGLGQSLCKRGRPAPWLPPGGHGPVLDR